MNKQPLYVCAHHWLCRAMSKLQRSFQAGLLLLMVLLSVYLVADDVLGTYLMYSVDQKTGEISENEYATATLSISKDKKGSFTALYTMEVSEEQWRKQQAARKEAVGKEFSPETKQYIEQFGALISGVDPSETEGLVDELLERDFDLKYEDHKKTVETALNVSVRGNKVAIFVPEPGGNPQGTVNINGKEEIWGKTYAIIIKDGELNGNLMFHNGSVLPSTKVKVHGKLVKEAPPSEAEQGDETETDDVVDESGWRG